MAVQYFPMVARLADGTFEPSLPGQGGTVVHVGTVDPADISEDAAGEQMIPASRLTVGTDAPLVPGFFSLDDSHYLDWLADNGLRVPLFSPEGSAQAAQAAQEAVEAVRGQVTDFINTGGRLHIIGTLSTADDLPEAPDQPTDAWLIDGDLWAWTESDGWANTGRVQGPKGERGDSGITWEELDTPDVFPPAAHSHPAGDITGTLDAARIPALPYRGSNWTPTAEQVQGLETFVQDHTPEQTVVRLDEVELTGPTTTDHRLSIPPALQGQFSQYVITIRAGTAEVANDGTRRVCVYINSDQDENYRDAVQGIDDSVNNTALPRSAFVGRFGGFATMTLHPRDTGDTDLIYWHTTGITNQGAPNYASTFLAGGRWSGGATQAITHFLITTSTATTWNNNSTATLWGQR